MIVSEAGIGSPPNRVCYVYKKRLATTAGFQVKRLNSDMLDERLRAYWANRLDLAKFKTARDIWHWFRMADRPARSSDSLGIYKYGSKPQVPNFIAWKASRKLVDGNVQTGNWDFDVTVINSDIFEWLFEDDAVGPERIRISELLATEFRIYQFHLRIPPGKPQMGWLRSMFHQVFTYQSNSGQSG